MDKEKEGKTHISCRTIATKALAVLVMLLGGLTSLSAWILVGAKAHVAVEYEGPHRPPNTILELALLYGGLAIIVCGLFQWMSRVKFGRLQTLSGLVVAGIAFYLLQRQISSGVYLDSLIYYLALIPLALGIVVFAIGFLQLINKGKRGLNPST